MLKAIIAAAVVIIALILGGLLANRLKGSIDDD